MEMDRDPTAMQSFCFETVKRSGGWHLDQWTLHAMLLHVRGRPAHRARWKPCLWDAQPLVGRLWVLGGPAARVGGGEEPTFFASARPEARNEYHYSSVMHACKYPVGSRDVSCDCFLLSSSPVAPKGPFIRSRSLPTRPRTYLPAFLSAEEIQMKTPISSMADVQIQKQASNTCSNL